jgi:hypothetical protein
VAGLKREARLPEDKAAQLRFDFESEMAWLNAA